MNVGKLLKNRFMVFFFKETGKNTKEIKKEATTRYLNKLQSTSAHDRKHLRRD